jgi:hypothetical protein
VLARDAGLGAGRDAELDELGCAACGAVAAAHTWRDGWVGSLYEERCEVCYFEASTGRPPSRLGPVGVAEDEAAPAEVGPHRLVEAGAPAGSVVVGAVRLEQFSAV